MQVVSNKITFTKFFAIGGCFTQTFANFTYCRRVNDEIEKVRIIVAGLGGAIEKIINRLEMHDEISSNVIIDFRGLYSL